MSPKLLDFQTRTRNKNSRTIISFQPSFSSQVNRLANNGFVNKKIKAKTRNNVGIYKNFVLCKSVETDSCALQK